MVLCCNLVTTFCFRRLVTTFCFRRLVTTFYLRVGDSDKPNIFDQTETTKIMVVGMLQNLSHRYSSHYSITKFVGFEPIYYAINLSVVSSSMIFIDLVFMFLLMYC